MNVRNCKNCGKLFNYVVGPAICPACKDSLEAKYEEVKEYVREHKGCTIPQVAEECDVREDQIRQWIREDRLEFSAESAIGLSCETCGTSIRSGRYCDKCKAATLQGLNGVLRSGRPDPVPQKKDTKENPKMRFL